MAKISINMAEITSDTPSGSSDTLNRLYSDRIDMLRARVSVLAGRDKALMQMYLRNGSTFSQMARLAGVNEATIARRINKLISRLVDGEYITCLRKRNQLDAMDRCIAKDYFIEGLSQKKIAIKRNITIYCVRKKLHKIQRLVRVTDGAA